MGKTERSYIKEDEFVEKRKPNRKKKRRNNKKHFFKLNGSNLEKFQENLEEYEDLDDFESFKRHK